MGIPLATLHPTTLEFEAIVTHVHDDGSVELSETYFYPTGGGQPNDTGVLTFDDKDVRVTDVRKREGAIVHTLETPVPKGTRVRGKIDAQRRERHRRMHTALHIVCALFEKDAGTKITGNQIGEEKSRIDVDLEEFDPERISQMIAQASAIAEQGIAVRRTVTTRDELMKNPALVKLAAGFPEHVQEVHLVEIIDVDVQPCAGTHVENTSEIGRIVFLKAENRGKRNRRIYLSVE